MLIVRPTSIIVVLQHLNISHPISMTPQPFEQIHKTVRPIAYSPIDLEALKVYFAGVQKNGLDLWIDGGFENVPKMMQEGLIMLQSYDLQSQFAFINVDAGRGLFGGQKTRVATYTADLYRNEYLPGPVLSGLLRALVGINNIYRAEGFLKGSGI